MALNKYNVVLKTDYTLNALVSVEGPIINGIKVNRLLNQYQNGVTLVQDNENNYVVDNEGVPVLSGTPGFLPGQIFIFGNMIQVLETIKYAVYTQTDLQTAAGYTLQRWGALLNVPPSGLSDLVYKSVIFSTIQEYTSKGTINNLIQIFQNLTNATSVFFQEFFPAKFQMTAINVNPVLSISYILQAILNSKGGGIGAQLVLTDANPFDFSLDGFGTGFGGIGFWTPLLNESGSPILNEMGLEILIFESGVSSPYGGDFSGIL